MSRVKILLVVSLVRRTNLFQNLYCERFYISMLHPFLEFIFNILASSWTEKQQDIVFAILKIIPQEYAQLNIIVLTPE